MRKEGGIPAQVKTSAGSNRIRHILPVVRLEYIPTVIVWHEDCDDHRPITPPITTQQTFYMTLVLQQKTLRSFTRFSHLEPPISL